MMFISDKYTEIFGVEEKEYVGKLDKDVWPESVAALFKKQDMDVIRTGGNVFREEPTPLATLEEWKRCMTLSGNTNT